MRNGPMLQNVSYGETNAVAGEALSPVPCPEWSRSMTQDASVFRDPQPGMDQAPAVPTPDFMNALLAALTQMAALSPRRQADVAVAMRRAGLGCAVSEVMAALDHLRREGCIENPLQLSDGGILVSVTARGIERLAATAHRHVVAQLVAPAAQ